VYSPRVWRWSCGAPCSSIWITVFSTCVEILLILLTIQVQILVTLLVGRLAD